MMKLVPAQKLGVGDMVNIWNLPALIIEIKQQPFEWRLGIKVYIDNQIVMFYFNKDDELLTVGQLTNSQYTPSVMIQGWLNQ